ncbi:MAG: hypothetical protein ABH857_04990 [Elusimicrobiota bacterium]
MKKRISAIIACAMLLQSFSFGYDIVVDVANNKIKNTVATSILETQDTRTATLELANHQLIGDFNVWYNPAQVNNYKGVYAEIWNGNPWGGTLTEAFGGTIGVFMGRGYLGNVQNHGTNIAHWINPKATQVEALPSGIASPFGINNDSFIYDLTALALGNKQIDVLYGRELSDRISGGLRLSFASATNEAEARFEDTTVSFAGEGWEKNNQKASDTQISAGLVIKDVGPADTLDIVIGASLPKIDNTYTAEIELGASIFAKVNSTMKSDNNINLGASARAIKKAANGNVNILTAGIDMGDTSAKWIEQFDNNIALFGWDNTNDEQTYDDKDTTIQIDYALHTMPSKKIKVIYAAGLVTYNREITIEDRDKGIGALVASELMADSVAKFTGFGVPIVVALEHQTTKRLVTRFAIGTQLMSSYKMTLRERDYYDINVDGVNETINQEDYREVTLTPRDITVDTSLGLGYKLTDDMDVDLAVSVTNADFFGTVTGACYVTQASVKYKF